MRPMTFTFTLLLACTEKVEEDNVAQERESASLTDDGELETDGEDREDREEDSEEDSEDESEDENDERDESRCEAYAEQVYGECIDGRFW